MAKAKTPPWYGAVMGGPSTSPYTTKRVYLNIYCLVWLLLAPTFVFGLMFGVMSFATRTTGPNGEAQSPWLTWLLALLLGFVCIYLGYYTYNAYVNWKNGEGSFEQFLILLCLLLSVFGALIFSVALGQYNYYANSKDLQALNKLNAYYDVNACTSSGQQLMDAGRVAFGQGTSLNLALGGGFRDRTIYCVAPIVCANPPASIGTAAGPPYDFWAVGTNCCSGLYNDTSFSCKNYNNPSANGGLRLVNDKQRSYYRMAVQQVEAAYNIRATHPIFFHWVDDAFEEASEQSAKASKFFAMGMGGFMMYQLLIVVCLAFYLMKHGFDAGPSEQQP